MLKIGRQLARSSVPVNAHVAGRKSGFSLKRRVSNQGSQQPDP